MANMPDPNEPLTRYASSAFRAACDAARIAAHDVGVGSIGPRAAVAREAMAAMAAASDADEAAQAGDIPAAKAAHDRAQRALAECQRLGRI